LLPSTQGQWIASQLRSAVPYCNLFQYVLKLILSLFVHFTRFGISGYGEVEVSVGGERITEIGKFL
jgi:hypothetical protein